MGSKNDWHAVSVTAQEVQTDKKFGLTADEVENGLTVEAKLEKLCYGYRRWDNLYGSRQNVNPSFVLESLDDDEEEELFDDDDDGFFAVDHAAGRAESWQGETNSGALQSDFSREVISTSFSSEPPPSLPNTLTAAYAPAIPTTVTIPGPRWPEKSHPSGRNCYN